MHALRRSALALAPKRSGHPDFPNVANYKHKRSIGLSDPMNMVFDGVHPEPLFDTILPYMTGPVLFSKWFKFLATAITTGIGLSWLLISNSYHGFTPSFDTNEANPRRQFLKQLLDNGSFERPSPLGHTRTIGNGGRHSRRDSGLVKHYKL